MNYDTQASAALQDRLRDPSLLETRAWLASGWQEASDGRSFAVTNPTTGEILARVASLSGAEVD